MLTDDELAEIEIIAQRHQSDRRPEEHWRLLEAIPSIISELRDARAVDDQIRERLAFLDKAIADGRFPEPKTVCAHCQAEHDVESGAMAAHVPRREGARAMSYRTDRDTLTDDQIEAWEIVAKNASQTDYTWQYGAVRENVLEYVRDTYERDAPGPLHTVHFQADEADHQSWIVAFTGNGKHSEANARYIAWSSPRNVLALLREVRGLRDRARPAQVNVDEAFVRRCESFAKGDE